jgi:antitoxin component YwqK of YwqJK toxin-antitoxin module
VSAFAERGDVHYFQPESALAADKRKPEKHTEYHKDGTIWADGQMLNGVPVGFWEWFRKVGTKMRSGTFDEAGNRTGEWTTYNKAGATHKVTDMNRKLKLKSKS